MFSEESVTSYMTLECDFHGNRIIGRSLVPVTWNLTISLIGVEDSKLSTNENQTQITIAYQRLNFWLDSILDNVIVADRNDPVAEQLFVCQLDNVIMHVPSEPTDDILCQILHAKMSALAGSSLIIGKITLKANDTRSSYMFYPVEESDYELPEASDYVEGESVYDLPWWHRNDMDVHDISIPEGVTKEELIEELSTAYIVDEFNKEMMATICPGLEDNKLEDDSTTWTPTVVK